MEIATDDNMIRQPVSIKNNQKQHTVNTFAKTLIIIKLHDLSLRRDRIIYILHGPLMLPLKIYSKCDITNRHKSSPTLNLSVRSITTTNLIFP